MSSGGNDEGDQKKRSQMIDRGLEEDSKKLRRECKILLLGKEFVAIPDAPHACCLQARATGRTLVLTVRL